MSQLREVEGLVSEMLDRYFDTLEAEDTNERQFVEDYHVVTTMTESARAMFVHDWAERLRAAVLSDVHGVIRPPPLNGGGGLFVREG